MAAIHLFLGDDLSASNLGVLRSNFDKRSIDLEYELGNTDLNGKFIDTSDYSADLWKTLTKAIGLKTPPSPKKIGGGPIDRPGSYQVEIEVKGYVFKGKIGFKRKPGDKTTPQIKPNSHPAKVLLKSAGANTSKLPKQLKADLDDLVKEMKKTANYSHTGTPGAADKGWAAKFGKHFVHLDPGTGARKSYVDSITNGTGSVWRMYFDVDFNYTTQALTVSLTDLREEHKSGGRS